MVTPVDFKGISIQEGLREVVGYSQLWHGVLLGVGHAEELHVELERQ